MLYGLIQKCAVLLANQLRAVADAFCPFKTVKGLVDYVSDGELCDLCGRVPYLPRFILVVSSSDALLAVSTLSIF